LTRKKGRAFMPWSERAEILASMRMVDEVIEFDDWDGSAKHAIVTVRSKYPTAEIIFANGGDRTQENIPEMTVVDDQLEFCFGIGGANKKNSSSWILEDWKAPTTHRDWGHYRVLYTHDVTVKVKELVVDPRQRLSMQRHQYRTELWFVVDGIATVFSLDENGKITHQCDCGQNNNVLIRRNQWHQLANLTDQPLKLVEIQYGEQCVEEDIDRQ